MRDRGAAETRSGWLERAVAAALVVVALAAVIAAVRLGAAAGTGGKELLAELGARTERRVAAERDQIRPALAAAVQGERALARREAEAALEGLAGNSQLHLLLAGVYRDAGATAPALREYRRAVELLRDYTDRRSPQFIGAGLAPWLREVRPGLEGAARGDLHYLERALAGGCS
jgi:tetratricopeptide (TPR) repeat protein